MSPNSPNPDGLTVLIVDADPDLAEETARYLRQLGHQVEVALDGQSALKIAQANRPDVAVLDESLSDMDGDEVAKTLARQGQWKRPFLVLLSAGSAKTGIDLCLAKPVNLDWLRALLGRLQAIIRPLPTTDVPACR